jgi:DNA-binding response OmpR family regulator
MTEQKMKILVVDDEESVGQVLKAGLEMHGFTVRYESRSTETIKACLEFHPDLVLLDVDMPVKDGGQVASELRSHSTLRDTPVIFLTALVTKEESVEQNAPRGIFLSKQIRIAELVAGIRAVLQPQTPH